MKAFIRATKSSHNIHNTVLKIELRNITITQLNGKCKNN